MSPMTLSAWKNRTGVLLGVVVIAVLAVVAQSVDGSVTTIKSKGRVKSETRYQVAVAGGSQEAILTVPARRNFIVTDLVVWNAGGTTASFKVQIQGGAELIPAMPVQSATSFSHAFSVGPKVTAGQILEVANVTGGSNLQFYVGGYLIKK